MPKLKEHCLSDGTVRQLGEKIRAWVKAHSPLVEIQTWWFSRGRESGGIYIRVPYLRFERGVTKMPSREEENRTLARLEDAYAKAERDRLRQYSEPVPLI